MKCVICGKEAMKNKVICSEKCSDVRRKLFELGDKYFPTRGCDNCWGDLHHGCTEQCRKEFREASDFCKDLWSLVRLIYPSEQNKKTDIKK